MRGAFVVRLARNTEPDQGQFKGWVEEVDSGQELRFHSTAELLRFLGQRFVAAFDLSRDGSTWGEGDPHAEEEEPPN